MRTMAFLLAMSFWMTPASSAQVKNAEELQRAIDLYDRGEYAEAIELYKKLIEVEPNIQGQMRGNHFMTIAIGMRVLDRERLHCRPL